MITRPISKYRRILLSLLLPAIVLGLGFFYFLNEGIRTDTSNKNQDRTETNFVGSGLLLRNEPGLKPDTWFLNYDQAGESGLLAELVFSENSTCTNGELTGSCEQPSFSQRQRVRVEGRLEGETLAVSNISDLEGGELNGPDASKVAFQESKVYGFYGTLTLTGFLRTERRICNPGDMCGETVDYASFVFKETDNQAIYDLLNQFSGNSFVSEGAVGVGCYQKDLNRIYSTNDADTNVSENIIREEDLNRLLGSSFSKPVKLKMTKPVYTSGRDAPDCYSHFRNFEVVQ